MSIKLSTSNINGVVIITLHDDALNHLNADAFLAAVLKITRTSSDNVIINFEEIRSIDSSGISKLLRLKTCLGVHGKTMSICNVNCKNSETTENTWLFKDILDIYKDIESALSA